MIYDNFLGRLLTRMFDLLVLNILFVLTSLPIFTIGAGLTALYSVTFQMIDNSQSSITSLYFAKFKENFKQSTIIWLGMLLVTMILFFDINLIKSQGTIQTILVPLIYFFLLLIAAYFVLVFPFVAKFKNTLKEYIQNTFFVFLSYLPTTLMVLALVFGPLTLSGFWFPKIYGGLIYFYLIFGLALTAYLNTFILSSAFNKLILAKSRS